MPNGPGHVAAAPGLMPSRMAVLVSQSADMILAPLADGAL
jgi:hypothetical protein